MTRSWCFGLMLLVVAGCAGDGGAPPPPHEFLVAAGDSTFWIRGERAGIHVRGSPLLLARLDDGFHEVYVTDDDRSYFEAVLIGQRLWRRDLVTGDSVMVFEDSLVPTLARAWARAHPDAVPLAPHEDASDEPERYASTALEILDLHGPYLSYEYHADVETRDGDETHLTRHGVLDLQRAERATLTSVFGADRAAQLEREGRRRFTAAVDSILRAESSLDRRTADALAGFAFDAHSFTIVEIGEESGVAFAIPGRGPHAGGLTLDLDPIPAGRPAWWKGIRSTLPAPGDDALVDRWSRPAYDVLARYSAGETAALALRAEPHEWPIATVPVPVSRIEWLDAPPIDSIDRRALSRAFDAAALYDETTRIVRRDGPVPVRLVSAAARPVAPVRRAPGHAPRRTDRAPSRHPSHATR